MSLRISIALLVGFAVVAGGCASTRIGRAKTLAAAATAASAKLGDAQTAIAASFADDRKAEDIQDALIGVPPTTPSDAFTHVLEGLQARAAVAAHLKVVYASFSALAGYDAKGEFETSAGKLIDAVNAAGKAVGHPVSVPDGVAKIGGDLLRLDQLHRLHRASLAIRRALTSYLEILESDRQAFVSTEQHAIEAHYDAVGAMWRKGVVSGGGLIGGLQPEDGLALVGKPEDYVVTKPVADKLVRVELARRTRVQQAAAEVAEHQQEVVVQELIAAHAAFERGDTLDLAELQTELDRLSAALVTLSRVKS